MVGFSYVDVDESFGLGKNWEDGASVCRLSVGVGLGVDGSEGPGFSSFERW